MSTDFLTAKHLEATHQDAMLSALYRRSDKLLGAATPYEQGLAAYRNNGSLNAARAMAVMFPAVYALLDEDDFYPLARLHWLAQPPTQGDWSQYGAGFGDWIAAHNPGGVLDALPYLPDLARLDDALSRCQDALNATADLSTLALLEQDPATVCMVLHPSVKALALNYDIAPYRTALLKGETLPQPQQIACNVVIARQDWRAMAHIVAPAEAMFVQQCLTGATVLDAHTAAITVDTAFEAAQWLSRAIPAQWLLRVDTISKH